MSDTKVLLRFNPDDVDRVERAIKEAVSLLRRRSLRLPAHLARELRESLGYRIGRIKHVSVPAMRTLELRARLHLPRRFLKALSAVRAFEVQGNV